MIRVLVSHAATMAGESLGQAMRDDGGFVVAVRPQAQDAARVMRADCPDVVVASVANLLDDAWSETLRARRVPLLALVDRHRGERTADASSLGADGICSEMDDAGQVIAAIRELLAGNGWLSQDLVLELLRDYGPICRRRAEARERIAHLGERDLRLLELLGAGKRNEEIAAELNLAISTVKEYAGRLLAGLGLTRRQAVALIQSAR